MELRHKTGKADLRGRKENKQEKGEEINIVPSQVLAMIPIHKIRIA